MVCECVAPGRLTCLVFVEMCARKNVVEWCHAESPSLFILHGLSVGVASCCFEFTSISGNLVI